MSSKLIDILLAEDNEDDVVLIRRAFSKVKLLNLVHVVQDGVEALDYLHRRSPYESAALPGLVLLDINMPKKNGFEVMEAMKADPFLRRIPVIMLTTSTRDQDIIRSYEGGACSYISKPPDMGQFIEIVSTFELYWTLVSSLPKGGETP